MNSRNMLIRDDHMGDGSIDQAAIYVREVIKRAMDLGSAALILVHNHPTRSERSRWITHKHAETLGNSRVFGLA
jgi:DNA repair protein RadC